ncbi:MAG: regulatory protein RecX [Alphaproteobacteria bacterium]
MKKITPERLKNSALYYLERYDASRQKLREVLERRLNKARLEQEVPMEAGQWIEDVIDQMQHLGYINDTRFAENLVRRCSEAGKSRTYIRTKLKLAGINDEQADNVLSEINDLAAARLMVQKKHLGQDFKRDLARLARAGFSYEIAKEALEEIKKGDFYV